MFAATNGQRSQIDPEQAWHWVILNTPHRSHTHLAKLSTYVDVEATAASRITDAVLQPSANQTRKRPAPNPRESQKDRQDFSRKRGRCLPGPSQRAR